MIDYFIRAIEDSDRTTVGHILSESWGSAKIVSRGAIHDADKLPGFITFSDDRIVGLITYDIKGTRCEIVTLNSFIENLGIGTSLIEKVSEKGIEFGCKYLWLVTTNDNLSAIRFYRKHGFNITAIHEGAIEKSRQIKPEIPLYGIDGIPIRDEIEMEIAILKDS